MKTKGNAVTDAKIMIFVAALLALSLMVDPLVDWLLAVTGY